MNNEIQYVSPFKKFCITVGNLPTAYLESMSYYEGLTYLVNYLSNNVIPALNNNGEAVEELQRLFKELETFVTHYVESPEFIANIDNKLDEMAEDGTFDQIINTNITGTLSNLETQDKSNLVSAINEVNSNVGDLTSLDTTSKTNTVSAINEVNTNVGDLTNLETTDKTDIVSAINEISGNVDDIEESITTISSSLNPIDLYKGKNLVVFGDSYSQENIPNSVNAHWVSRVCSATGMISKNFAVAGAGFARPLNLISDQLTTATAQLTQDEIDNTSIVIIYAGYNDIINNILTESIVTECKNFVSDVCSTFTKAKVILAPFNWGFNHLSYEYNMKIETAINKISREVSDKPVIVLKMARYWCLGIKTYYQNAGHPNESGYNKVASYFVNAIYGNSEHVGIGSDISSSLLHGNEATKILNYMFEDGNVYLYYSSSFPSNLTNYGDVLLNELPPLLCPDHDIFIPLYKLSDYEDCGYIRLTTSGQMSIHISSLDANTIVCATPITFKASVNTEY